MTIIMNIDHFVENDFDPQYIQCTVYVNKTSPYSNSNYLSSTVSIEQ